MPADAAAFFDRLGETFDTAARGAGRPVDHFFRIAGETIRLRFAGPALLTTLTRALSHLRSEPVSGPALTVRLWDSESTDTPMEPPPWQVEAYRELGRIDGFFAGGFYTMFSWGSNSLSMLDTARGEALYWVKRVGRIPYFETAAPHRTILHLWLEARGLQLVHGAAVGTDDGCVLLAGRAGAGKSSATLACLSSRLRLLADDYCVVAPGSPPTVHTLYSSAKTNGDTIGRLPFLGPLITNPERPRSEKALYFLHESLPEKLLAQAPLRAIIVPRVTGERRSALRDASPGTALAAMAPSTILQLPGADDGTLRRLATLVRSVPCHVLEAGTETAEVPELVLGLLERHAGAVPR